MHEKARQRLSRNGIRSGKGSRRYFALLLCPILLQMACGLGAVRETSPAVAPVVVVAGETLQGSILELDPPVAVFKGIPYAAPPVGERRWRPPRPASPRQGLQSAVEYGPSCVQDPDHVPDWYRYLAETFNQDPTLVPELGPISEDCLYLNVWTANLEGHDLWPVMVWIHGGSNTSGSPMELSYDGVSVTPKGVVVISINYRLNVMGFLAHPALTEESENDSSGNYGLLDQIAALEWIRQNIATFGGDPDRVTIFGESAGATNVAYLMSSPLAQGLFHRAIMQSGGYAVTEFRSLDEIEAMGEGIAKAIGVGGPEDVLGRLRAADAEILLQTALSGDASWESVPNVDGWVLEEAPGRVFESGNQAPVPLIVGFNSDEWTTLGHYGPEVTLEGLREGLRTAFGDHADRAIELYPATTGQEAAAAVNNWQTDATFACPSRFIADRVARTSNRIFFYLFTRSAPGPGGEQLGAYHGAETAYVMDNLALEPWVPRNAEDQRLADVMSDYWVQFAASGDPNDGTNPLWPVYESERREYLELGDRIQTGTGIRTDHCDLYDELQKQRLESGGQARGSG